MKVMHRLSATMVDFRCSWYVSPDPFSRVCLGRQVASLCCGLRSQKNIPGRYEDAPNPICISPGCMRDKVDWFSVFWILVQIFQIGFSLYIHFQKINA